MLWSASTGPNKVKAGELESRLQKVEEDLSINRANRDQLNQAAERTANELEHIQQKGIRLAKSLHVLSDRANKLEAHLKYLQKEKKVKSVAMAHQKSQLAATLSALQRISLMPTTAMLAIPQSPNDTLRSAILLRATVPKLQGEAADLAEELDTLTSLQAKIADDKKSLEMIQSGLTKKSQHLRSLTARKMALLGKTQTAEQRAARLTARLSARAGNIRDLLRELSRQRRTSVLPRRNSEQTQFGAVTKEKEKRTASRLTLKLQQGPSPAPGRIITSFGEKMPSGIISKGIFIETRSSAAVVAPIKGRVVFAGIFRGYGNLVILELPNKGHALIAGMVKVSAGIGDEVLAGEPIGEMAPSNSSPPKLYFELRRKGRPINPLPPKAAHRNKVRG